MKIIAVIPVHGRHSLLRLTIQRLYFKNRVDHVICIGESDNKEICEKAGAEFIEYINLPLGRKLNAGFLRARELKPDAVSFIGSSDWVCDTWFDIVSDYSAKYEIVGKRDFMMVHINGHILLSRWLGYPPGVREKEPIGIGRLCSASFMDKVRWMPFADHLNNSLDFSMIINMQKIGGTCFLYNSEEIQSLSISCDKWNNMHQFHNLAKLNYKFPYKWLEMWFPEIFELI